MTADMLPTVRVTPLPAVSPRRWPLLLSVVLVCVLLGVLTGL